MKKKTVRFTLLTNMVFGLLLLFGMSGAAADISYVYTDSKMLTKGVEFTSYDIFMSDRTWNRAYVAAADLSEPHLELQVLGDPRGINYLTTVSNVAQAYDTTAAINSDFFNWDARAGRGSPIGAAFFQQNMISSPAAGSNMYTILQNAGGEVFTDVVDYKIYITAPNGARKQIAGKNKASDLSQIMMFDKNYDSYSMGSTATQYEMVVRSGIVEEIRFESEPVQMTDDMYILSGLADWDSFLLDNFAVGDEVKVEIESSIDFNNLKLAAGAGAKILSDGTVPGSFSHTIGGINPRTAFGIDYSKKKVYLTVVDGRSGSSNGMTMTELGWFMKYIGAYNAVNLDGGGSSTFVAKNQQSGAQELINTPSDSAQRKVAAVLAVNSTVKKAGGLYHMKITPDGENVFKDSRINLAVEGFDEFYFPVGVDTSTLTYTVSGVDGYVENDVFYPKSAGIATVTAWAPNGAVTDVKIRVLDQPYKIEHEASTIELRTGEAKNFWLFVRDEAGYLAHVPIADMEVTFSDSIAHINGTAVVGDRSGSALMSVRYGNAVIYATVHVDGKHLDIPLPNDKTGTDTRNTASSGDSLMRFAVFGSVRESDTLFNNLIMKKALGSMNSSADMAFILSTKPTANIAPNLSIPVQTCYPFHSFVEKDNTFIVLDTEDDFMSAREWNWFINEVNNLQTQNVFVFMQTNLKFTSAKETKLLKDVLSDAAERGHTVYTFYNNSLTGSTPEDGVRYISTPGFSSDITASNFPSLSSKLRFITVDIDSRQHVTYQIKQLY